MNKDIATAAAAVAVVAAVSFGLSTTRPDVPMRPSQPFGGERGAASSSPKKKAAGKAAGNVVMHVNGVPVTELEFAAFLQSVPENTRPYYSNPAGRRALADEVVRIKLLEEEARRLGLSDDPVITTRVDMMRSQMVAGRALEALMKGRMQAAMRAEYEKEKNNSVSLRHILIAYQGGTAPSKNPDKALTAAQAMQKATGLVARLRAGAEFAEVARRESDDQQSAAQGGSLGPAKPEMLPPEVAEVVKKLEPGRVSDAVKTQFGVHIFMTSVPTFEDLQPMLAQQVQQKIMLETLAALQKGAKVELDPKFFPQDSAPPRPRVNS